MRKYTGWLLCVISLMAPASLNAAAPKYNVQSLGGSFGPSGINNYGQMCGTSSGTAYFKDVGQNPQVLPKPAGMGRYGVTGLNDSGVAIGYAADFSHDSALLWRSDHTVVNLGSLSGDARANDINTVGKVVGEGIYSDGRNYGWTWTESGGMQYLSTLNGYDIVRARAINDAGQAVGYASNLGVAGAHAVLWQADGTIVDLSPSSQGAWVSAADINNQGQVVGSTDGIAWFWSSASGMVNLPTLSGASNTSASSINSSGWIVGNTFIGTKSHALIWSPDHHVYDLGTFEGRQTCWAFRINDSGQVIGSAYYTSGAMQSVGLLWTPVPEPSSFIALSGGLVGLVGLRRRRA